MAAGQRCAQPGAELRSLHSRNPPHPWDPTSVGPDKEHEILQVKRTWSKRLGSKMCFLVLCLLRQQMSAFGACCLDRLAGHLPIHVSVVCSEVAGAVSLTSSESKSCIVNLTCLL